MKYQVLQLPYRITGLDDTLPIRVQRNLDAIAEAVSQMQMYENATGLGANDLLTNTVADERLGASIAGFKRGSVAYKSYGTQVLANLPRYEYARQAAPVWEDLFDIDMLSLEYTSGGDVAATWAVSGGVLSGNSVADGNQSTLIKKDLTLTDVEIEVTSDQCNQGGIIGRYQDNNNYYLVRLSDDSGAAPTANLTFYKRVASTFTVIGQADVTWVRGTAKIIKFTLRGSLLEGWFDGVKVVSVTDTTYASGNVGLRTSSTVASRYLDFKVYQASRTLMMEEGTANTLLYSDQFDNANWIIGGTPVITANSTVAPDGTTTADTIQDDDATAYESVYQAGSVACANSQTWTASVYIKKDTNTTRYPELQLKFSGGTALYYIVQINTQTGATTVRAGFGTADNITVQSVGDYWRLCITGTNNATGNTAVSSIFFPAVTTVWGNTEATATGSCIVWRAQLEKKKYVTSSIQTTTAAVTRSAETCVLPTAGVFAKNNWAVEMTFTPMSKQDITGRTAWMWRCFIDTMNYYDLLIPETGKPYVRIKSGGTFYSTDNTNSPVLQVGTSYSIMMSGDGANIRFCVNGAQIGIDIPYVEPVGTLPTLMYAGGADVAGYESNGLIDDLRFSSRARTYREHYDAWKRGTPLEVDDPTNLKMDFDNTLRQTTRKHTSREQGTFMVADASTTKDKTKATHIIPVGWTSAQVVVNQAISELPSTGGKIVAMDGAGIVDGSIIVPSNVELDLTTMTLKIKDSLNTDINVITNSDATNGNTNIKVKNGTLDGNKANNSAGTQQGVYFIKVANGRIEKGFMKNFRGHNIYLDSSNGNIVSSCILNDSGWNGIEMVASSNNTVTGCIFQNNTLNDGIRGQASSNNNTFTGNTFKGNFRGIQVANSSNNTVSSNACQGNSYGIFLLGTSINNAIIGNICQGNSYSGICVFANPSNNVIAGNSCLENSQAANATYDNIFIDSNADNNNIQNNICRAGSLANKPRYGICINTADCNTNFVTNNDLTTGGVTSSYSDAGTGTVTAAGNRL